MKDLLLDFVEVTEAAALAVFEHIGCGDKSLIDKVSTDAMRERLNKLPMLAEVVIGEGIKDQSAGLFKGERLGSKRLRQDIQDQIDALYGFVEYREYDIAIDPVDGTTQAAKNGSEAMSIIAIGEYGSLLPIENFYMNKIAVAEGIEVNIEDPIEDTIKSISAQLGRSISVCVLNRPRHQKLIETLAAHNCFVRVIPDCDVTAAIAAAMGKVDLFVGVGGATEGVLSAAAIKCLGGTFQGQIVDNKTYLPVDKKIYNVEDLAKGHVAFVATGILDGMLLDGIKYKDKRFKTSSILMESNIKGFRRIDGNYRNKL